MVLMSLLFLESHIVALYSKVDLTCGIYAISFSLRLYKNVATFQTMIVNYDLEVWIFLYE